MSIKCKTRDISISAGRYYNFYIDIRYGQNIIESEYSLHELPMDDSKESDVGEVVLHTAVLSKIEALQSENQQLRKQLADLTSSVQVFTASAFAANNKLIKLYTGFPSYEIFIYFYGFLGPSVDKLTYWGDKEFTRKRHRKRKLSSLDQFFLTLMKLKLNLRNKDLGVRFALIYLSHWYPTTLPLGYVLFM